VGNSGGGGGIVGQNGAGAVGVSLSGGLVVVVAGVVAAWF
jgi:hypothetical protein